MAAWAWGSSTSTSSAPIFSRARAASWVLALTSGAKPAASKNAGTTPIFMPRTPSARFAVKSTSLGWLVQSNASRPAMAFRTSAASSTERAKGPTWSSELPKATTP